MDDAKKALALKVKRPPATSWFDIFKKKQPVTIDDVDVILSLALDIISPNPGAIDDTHTFSIDNKGSEAFAGLVWISGFAIRQWCNILIAHYSKTGDAINKANVLLQKAKITCSIMNHYPYEVGPDMLACVFVLEEINNINLAQEYNDAVIADFEHIVEDIKNYMGEGINVQDIICLQTLTEVYKNKQRFEGTIEYESAIESLEAIIAVGVTAAPEEEEEQK